jgi:hypothetical protein
MKLLFIVIIFLTFANAAFALPRFSLLTGMQCINCHANPTGDELRNSFGSSDFVDDHLRLVPAHGDSTDYNFNPQLNDYILLGGDVRFQYLYDGDQKKTTFQSMEGSIYSLFRLFTSTDLFVKYDFANTAYEAYGLYKFNSDNSYVKVGAFEPSYGIRLDDHTAYTRGGNLGFLQGLDQVGLFFVPDYRDLGVEVGSRFDDLFVTVDATNGDGLSNINFTSNKAFIGKAEYLMKGNFMIGASGYTAGSLNMYGLQAGAGIGERLTILGEWDWTNSLPDLPDTLVQDYGNAKSNAAFVEVTYFITNGLTATGRFDYFRTVIGGPVYERYVIGADVYPIPHIDLTPQIRFNTNNVINAPRPFEALIQSHIYF